jgi:hypothetical protein
MGQPADHRVAWRSFAAAPTAPLIGLDDSAREHGAIGLEPLPDRFKAELVETAEHGQVGAGEARTRGSVRHVEVFQMGSVRTSILGRPRPLSGHRRAAWSAESPTPSSGKSL